MSRRTLALEMNNSGAWKTLLHVTVYSGMEEIVLETAAASLFGMEDAGGRRATTLRIRNIDTGEVINRWSHGTGWGLPL